MLTVPQYTLWLGVTIIEILALYIAISCGQIRRFWDLYAYFGLGSIASLSRYVVLERNGFGSREYAYLYYFTDAILTFSLFLVAIRLFGHIYNLKTWNGIPLRLAIPGMMCVALLSYGNVQEAQSRLLIRFVLELSQNFYFAILILVTGGWIGTLVKKLRASTEVKLLWVLIIHAGILANAYFARNSHPQAYPYVAFLSQLSGLWLTTGSAFAVLFDDRRVA
jgi:hypothetical protein